MFRVIGCSVFAIVGHKFALSNPFLNSLSGLFGNPSWLSVLGSRLLFNLKEAGEQGRNQGTSLGVASRTVSDMHFAELADQSW